jgi:hypothetical protein
MYYKGTQLECDAYNAFVTEGQNYSGTTTRWAEPYEVDGFWYIVKNSNYLSEMVEVEAMPIVKIEL